MIHGGANYRFMNVTVIETAAEAPVGVSGILRTREV